MVRQLTGQRCCGGWIQALQEEPAVQQGGKLPFMWENSKNAKHRALLWSPLGAYGSGLAGRPVWEILLWLSAMSHLIRKMRPPSNNWKEPCIRRPWSSWDTLTTWWPAGGTNQQGTSNLGGFCYALMTNSWPRWSRSWQGGVLLLEFIPTNMWEVKVRSSLNCSDHGMVEFRILSGGSWANKQDLNPGLKESSLWLV